MKILLLLICISWLSGCERKYCVEWEKEATEKVGVGRRKNDTTSF